MNVENWMQFVIGPGVTLFAGYLLGKRKSNAEARLLEIQASEKIIEFYKNMAELAKQELEKNIAARLKDEQTVHDLSKEITHLREQVDKLTLENKQLRELIQQLKNLKKA